MASRRMRSNLIGASLRRLLLPFAWTLSVAVSAPGIGPCRGLNSSTAHGILRRGEGPMNRIHRTWSLMSACWQVLRQDKALLVFPFMSGTCCLLLLGSVALPLYLIILGLVQSALQSIFQAAVFLYARDGQVPAGFEAGLLGSAMVRK
jgi:hypothetical protein